MVAEKTSPIEINIAFNMEEHTDHFYKFIYFIQPKWVEYLEKLNEGDIEKTTSFAKHLDLQTPQ